MTYDDHPRIHDLYQNHPTAKVTLAYSTGHRTSHTNRGTELLIASPDMATTLTAPPPLTLFPLQAS